MKPQWLTDKLAETPLPTKMPYFCGVPATEFTAEELVKILTSAMEDTEREKHLHAATRSMLR